MWAQIIPDALEVSMVLLAGRMTRAAKRLSANEDPEYPTEVLEAGWNPEVDRLRPVDEIPVDEIQAENESNPDPVSEGVVND